MAASSTVGGAISFQLTLTGVAQRVSDAYGDGVGAVNAVHDVPYRTLVLQAQKAGADMFIGGDNTTSGTVFGVRLDPTATTPPLVLGGFDMGGIKLSDLWVFGTNGQTLTGLGIPL